MFFDLLINRQRAVVHVWLYRVIYYEIAIQLRFGAEAGFWVLGVTSEDGF